ncbi:hypothetical protein ACFLXT_00650 [Chloroflexota bacterium]
MSLINRLFEHHAGFVYLICLIILLEVLLPIISSWPILISGILYLVFLSWQIVLYMAIFYTVAKGGWVEKELRSKLEQINKEEPVTD